MLKIPGFRGPGNFVPGWDKPSQDRIFLSHSQAGDGDRPGKKLPASPAGRKAPFPEGGELPALASTPGRRGRGQAALGRAGPTRPAEQGPGSRDAPRPSGHSGAAPPAPRDQVGRPALLAKPVISARPMPGSRIRALGRSRRCLGM